MIRVGLIGAGAWGVNHARVVSSAPHVQLAAVADPDPAARARVGIMAPSARVVADPDELIADPELDALVIASPAATHAPLARAAFAAGKHVLIEKPVATSLRDALEVREAARRAGRVGVVGHLMIHHPAVTHLRELLQTGRLGTLHYLHGTRVNLGTLRRDENALWSLGPHDLSMIDFLIEREPISVAARGQRVLQAGVEDVVFLTLRFATGEMAHLHLSWLSPRKERRLVLVGSKKMAEFDDVGTDKLRIYDKGYDQLADATDFTLRDGDVHVPTLALQEPLRLQFTHFIDCIRDGNVATDSLDRAIRVTRVLDAAQQSLREDGAPVELAKTYLKSVG